MKHLPLGQTSLSVSQLGLGTVKLGRDRGVKYPVPFQLPSDEQALALLAKARALGINFIDTAPAYGIAEERLGRLTEGNWAGWVVSTKVGEEFEDGVSCFDFSLEHTRFSLDRSRSRLRLDVLDLVLIHSDGNDLEVLRQDVVDELRRQKESGRIRAWGISTKTVAGGLGAVRLGVDAVMVTHNLDYTDERPVIDAAHDAGCAVLVKKALASGHADAEASLRFVAGTPGVTSVIVGTLNPAHLDKNSLAVS
jgi:aryl-alcohol dehydrogenase-like predicted oxidoreductase